MSSTAKCTFGANYLKRQDVFSIDSDTGENIYIGGLQQEADGEWLFSPDDACLFDADDLTEVALKLCELNHSRH